MEPIKENKNYQVLFIFHHGPVISEPMTFENALKVAEKEKQRTALARRTRYSMIDAIVVPITKQGKEIPKCLK